MKKPEINCEFYSFGDCRHPQAPRPGAFSWRAWPKCILGTADVRVACCARVPGPQPMPCDERQVVTLHRRDIAPPRRP